MLDREFKLLSWQCRACRCISTFLFILMYIYSTATVRAGQKEDKRDIFLFLSLRRITRVRLLDLSIEDFIYFNLISRRMSRYAFSCCNARAFLLVTYNGQWWLTWQPTYGYKQSLCWVSGRCWCYTMHNLGSGMCVSHVVERLDSRLGSMYLFPIAAGPQRLPIGGNYHVG